MQDKRKQQLASFCASQNIQMHDLELLEMALTHTSYAHEAKQTPKPQHNERIEFLGDSVLSVIVSTYMFKHFPELAEGQLTKLRAHLVCEGSLYTFAKKLGLGELLLVGRGEELSGGRERPSILADMVESIIAAMYLDGGLDRAREFVLSRVLNNVEISETHRSADYKTALQELVQQKKNQTLSYALVGQSGPDHDKKFDVEVCLNGCVVGSGSGSSRLNVAL